MQDKRGHTPRGCGLWTGAIFAGGALLGQVLNERFTMFDIFPGVVINFVFWFVIAYGFAWIALKLRGGTTSPPE